MSDVTRVKWQIMHSRYWEWYEKNGYTLIAQMGDYDIVAKGEYDCEPYSDEEYECLEHIVDLHNHIVKTNWGE